MMKIRSFIAINLPEEIKSYLKGVLEELQNNNPYGIKWVNSEGLHITLHFLGFCDENQLKEISQIIEKEINNFSFNKDKTLELDYLGAFPNLNYPRVVFLNTNELNGEYFRQIREKIGVGLERIGVKVDYRPWQPHITLGRKKFIEENIRLDLKNLQIEKLNFKVKSIELMKSELRPQGANYSIIKSFPI